jgi:monoamine oxidase
MSKPTGRLHFCGEHTATSARGLEGALESSERVVLEVLAA